jgi:hypothetical protein
VLLLAAVDDRAIKLTLGGVIAAFSIYSLAVRDTPRLAGDHAGWLTVCGVLAGVFGGAYGMNGPPLVMYGSLRRWSPEHFRATLQGYFLPASIVGMAGYGVAGLWTSSVNRYFLLSFPAVIVATALGRAINRRVDSRRFFIVVHVGLIAIGLGLLLMSFMTVASRGRLASLVYCRLTACDL